MYINNCTTCGERCHLTCEWQADANMVRITFAVIRKSQRGYIRLCVRRDAWCRGGCVDDIYGGRRPQMEAMLDSLVTEIRELRANMIAQTGFDPIEHLLARVKSEESMRDKCRRKGLPETPESALQKVYDALGVRIVCGFLSDVYAIRDSIANSAKFDVVEERDYIRHAKPNGYRSYHMIIRSQSGYYAEVQLRTISMDTWASLEHHLHYKKKHGGNQKLIVQELKRCADELASTDVSMQTIRDMIMSEEE